MLVTQCDICEKLVEKGKGYISVGENFPFGQYSFCKDCGEPVHQFLVQNGLIKESKKKKERVSVKIGLK